MCPGQGLPHRPLQIGDHLALETALELARINACFVQDTLSREITVGRIVLMQCVHRYPVGRGEGSASKRIAKRVVAFIGDADPVHGTKHDRLASAQQDNASCPEPQLPVIGYRIVSHHRADRRGGIHVEGGYTQSRCRRIGCNGGFSSREGNTAHAQDANG